MKHLHTLALMPLLALSIGIAHADSYSDTVAVFKNAGASDTFFAKSYAYAVFPTIGSGALIVGRAHATSPASLHGSPTGNASVTQATLGFHARGPAYSGITFFADQRALDES